MNRVKAFFVEEAQECLDAAEAQLADGAPDPAAVHAAVRKFRGSAQVARFGDIAEEAWTLERELKAVARGDAVWDASLEGTVKEALASLDRAVDAVRDGGVEPDAREESMDQDVNDGEAGEVVPIESIEYSGKAALERAVALREPLEDAIVAGDPTGALLDELFDLIRLGGK